MARVEEEGVESNEDRRGRKVLIVDPDPEFADDLRVLLDGDRIVVARDVGEAADFAEGGRVDVVVLGPSFGNEAGVRSAGAIVAADPSATVLLAANVVTNRILLAALQTGLADVVDLPVTAKKLSAALGRSAPRTVREASTAELGGAAAAAEPAQSVRADPADSPDSRPPWSEQDDPRFAPLQAPSPALPPDDIDPRFDDEDVEPFVSRVLPREAAVAEPAGTEPDSVELSFSLEDDPLGPEVEAEPELGPVEAESEPGPADGLELFGDQIAALLARQEELLRAVEEERTLRAEPDRRAVSPEPALRAPFAMSMDEEPALERPEMPEATLPEEPLDEEPVELEPFDPGFAAVPPGAAGGEADGDERASLGGVDIDWPDEPEQSDWGSGETSAVEAPSIESGFWEQFSDEDLAEIRASLAPEDPKSEEPEPEGLSAEPESLWLPEVPPASPPGAEAGGETPADPFGASPSVTPLRVPEPETLPDALEAPDTGGPFAPPSGGPPDSPVGPPQADPVPPKPLAPPPMPGEPPPIGGAAEPSRRRDTPSIGRGNGKVVAVMSGKGGSGKTITATNLATALTLHLGSDRIAIVDADLQFGDVALLLQLEPTKTIADLTGDVDDLTAEGLERHMLVHESGLRVLAAPVLPATEDEIPVKQVIRMVELLTTTNDAVVVDTSPVFDDGLIDLLSHADRVLLVVDMDLPSVKNAKIALDTLRVSGFPMDRIRLIVNRVDSKARLDLVELERSLGREVFGTIPSDRLIPQSVNEGIPAVALGSRSKVARSFRKMAEALAEETGLRR